MYALRSTVIALALGLGVTTATHATSITVLNLDGAGEGFNDPTPRAPEGGNPGTTLGALRLNAFNEAANRWEAILDSSIVIGAEGKFDDLTCSSGGADDLTPAAIGFLPVCPMVKVPGSGPWCDQSVDTLAALVECVTCVSEFKVDCIDRTRVREFGQHPCECNP